MNNFVRCVRGGKADLTTRSPREDKSKFPYKLKDYDSAGSSAAAGRRKVFVSPPGGSDFIRRLDRNGDGKVSRSEFDGPPDRFDHHDMNRDGYLSGEEAPSGPPPGAGPRRQGKKPR